MAIEHALSILSWYENLPKKEIPPEHIWDDGEALSKWWKQVEELRGGDGDSDIELDDDNYTGNDLAATFKD